jgi:hypothetical protein
MMREVSSPLIDTGCRNAVLGMSRALIKAASMGFPLKVVKIVSLAAQLKIADVAERFELRCIAPARAA